MKNLHAKLDYGLFVIESICSTKNISCVSISFQDYVCIELKLTADKKSKKRSQIRSIIIIILHL